MHELMRAHKTDKACLVRWLRCRGEPVLFLSASLVPEEPGLSHASKPAITILGCPPGALALQLLIHA